MGYIQNTIGIFLLFQIVLIGQPGSTFINHNEQSTEYPSYLEIKYADFERLNHYVLPEEKVKFNFKGTLLGALIGSGTGFAVGAAVINNSYPRILNGMLLGSVYGVFGTLCGLVIDTLRYFNRKNSNSSIDKNTLNSKSR